MTERPVATEDLLHVLRFLWPRGVEELKLLGLSLSDAFYRFRHYRDHGHKSRALCVDDAPVVVVGIMVEDGEAFTWFQATADFDKHAKSITKFIRREAAAYPGPLFIYSVCVHPDTARWFRVLGFAPTDYAQELPSGATLRKFERV